MKIQHDWIIGMVALFILVGCEKGNPLSTSKEPEIPLEEIHATEWMYDTPWPFDQPPLASLRASDKKVFAHYFTQFPISIDNKESRLDYYETGYLAPAGEGGKHLSYGGYLRMRPLPREVRASSDWMHKDMQEEVARAAALGLDGFACDLLSDAGYHLDRVHMLLQAAEQNDAGFKIMLMPDMEAFKQEPDRITALITQLNAYESAYRTQDGRLVVSPYNAQVQPASWWRDWLMEMKHSGIDIAFFPLFQNWAKYAADFSPISYGMSDWGLRSPKAQASWVNVPAQAQAYGPLWMMPVAPQDMRPRELRYWEAAGSENYRVMWQNAIQGGADWVQLITWNDYAEHTSIAPSTGIQYSYYDLTAYYTTWFKTGVQPVIERDVLYYFYRMHSVSAKASAQDPFQIEKNVDGALDEIELLAFLTQPGTLEIELNGKKQQKQVPAGINSFRVPLREGRPVFRLIRDGQEKLVLPGAFTINNSLRYQNLLYLGGSNSRLPI